LLLDATVAPADIRYPTDIKLLNEAREQTEIVIDALYQQVKELPLLILSTASTAVTSGELMRPDSEF
jgi:hypothetical protein